MSQVDIREFSVTATITNLVDNSVWTVTGVYGPQEEAAKQQFLQEMRQIKPTAAGASMDPLGRLQSNLQGLRQE
jgi:hypothetical protein